MAAKFTASSTQYITCSSPPITGSGYPLTVGCWLRLASNGTAQQVIWALTDTATTDNYLAVSSNTNGRLGVAAAAGGLENLAMVATGMATGAWTFVLARFVASANRLISVIHSNGNTEHNVTSTARAPAGMDIMTLGIRSTTGSFFPFDGDVAEYWVANIDVQGDGAQIQVPTLRQLAYGGPFSVPHVGPNVLEYRSFRKSVVSDADSVGEVYHGTARRTWVGTGGPTVTDHPPLPYWYVRPNQTKRHLSV